MHRHTSTARRPWRRSLGRRCWSVQPSGERALELLAYKLTGLVRYGGEWKCEV